MKFLLGIILFSLYNFPHAFFEKNSQKTTRNIPIQVFKAKVIGVKDGDTYVVLDSLENQVTIRLAHIDCPEKKQPFGTQAKLYASDLCFGKEIKVAHYGEYDRNHRLIAEIYLLNGVNVNKELVKNGLAWHFKKYSNDSAYANLELQAREQKRGLWSLESALEPSQWRKNSKKTNK